MEREPPELLRGQTHNEELPDPVAINEEHDISEVERTHKCEALNRLIYPIAAILEAEGS